MAFTLGDNQKVTLRVVGTDEAGNPSSPPTGPFAWSIEDPTILQLDYVTEDTTTATISATGVLGTTRVFCSDQKLVGNGEITVVATDPVALGFVSGAPEHK